MSKDIRSFFTVLSKKPGSDSKPSTSRPPKKKPQKIIDSDDEDVVPNTPEPTPKKRKKETVILSSDSEDEKRTKAVKKSPSKLKPVSVSDVFKKTPIKQTKVEPLPKPVVEKKPEKEVKKSKSKKGKKKDTEIGVHDDPAFEQTLLELDDDIFENNLDELIETAENALQQSEEMKENVKQTKNDADEASTSERKRSRTDSSSEKITPKKKQKMEHTDSGIDPGQESYEKKRYSAMLYQKYLHRSGPKHHGMKEIPKGNPDCLKNLCFLRTGILDSLESEEFETLIKDHGGRVVQAVSKKVNYVVVGEDAGPSKLAKAESYKIPTISEDELLDMILVKSGKEAKYAKKDVSLSSEDLGIESDKNSKASDVEDDRVKTKKELNGEKKHETKKELNGDHPQPSTSKSAEISKPKEISPRKQTEIDPSSLSLTEKYKPKDTKAIIGQQGENSNLKKLRQWLLNWHKNQDPEVHKKLQRPSPWAKNDNGAYFKCALLSGPPGVGKTTTATLVAQELGLDIVELNASDTRSKRLLHETVSQLVCSKTIAGFASGQKSKVDSKRVLLMDEVDGMAGNEDRGGIQELIQLIKNTSIPIICMCNDRNHTKMRSLVNYCFDLKFAKPRMEQIRGAMLSVCFKEGLKIPANALSEIIQGTECDVRQTLNQLAMWAMSGNKNVTVEDAEKTAQNSKKDIVMGPWEVCRAVFTESEHKNMTLADKSRLFFFDYSIGPLFVQENYLKVQPAGKNQKQSLLRAALAADCISRGDLVDCKIRRSNNWALLETEAFYSSVFPGRYMSGHFTGQINFPAWLGKNSMKNKFNRILGEIQAHTRTTASASKMAVRLDYVVPLRNAIIRHLKRGNDGIDDAVAVMKAYNLLREDLDGLVELGQRMKGTNPMSSIDSKVKSAFTRAYNKQVTLLPYAPTSAVSKKKAAAQDLDLLGEEEEIESDKEDEDLSKNAMIKVKTKTTTAKGKKASEEAGSSKKGKGKGKKTK